MPDILACPHCAMRIIPTAFGTCPACGKELAAAVTPPPPPPKRRRRHPILFTLCLLLLFIGFMRYSHRVSDEFEGIVIDLALIWGGSIGLVALTLRRRLR